ncbi:HD domain-containing protein [Candidatus Woesebacteria bacterium]|nr:HD domain-containing protein [Candidatus Woesebacteria bacterium]
MSELPSREQSITLMNNHIQNSALRHHVDMVAAAMEAYAKNLGEDPELWYATGLLHDLDWEMYPDEHPNKAIAEMLSEYPQVMKDAIAAHAPDRTGRQPETTLDKYMFACDELSGLMHAYSLMRPTGFAGMEVKSVKKKIKDKAFAANVSRDDITRGFELIGKTPEEHIAFLIEVFNT